MSSVETLTLRDQARVFLVTPIRGTSLAWVTEIGGPMGEVEKAAATDWAHFCCRCGSECGYEEERPHFCTVWKMLAHSSRERACGGCSCFRGATRPGEHMSATQQCREKIAEYVKAGRPLPPWLVMWAAVADSSTPVAAPVCECADTLTCACDPVAAEQEETQQSVDDDPESEPSL